MKYAESTISNNAEKGLIAALKNPTPVMRQRSPKISLETTKRNNTFDWIKDYIRPEKSGKSYSYHMLQKWNSHFIKKLGHVTSPGCFEVRVNA